MKKSSPIVISVIIMVLCCFCCCSSSMSTGIMGVRTARNLGGREMVEYKPAKENAAHSSTSAREHQRETARASNVQPKPLSTKPMKVQLYQTYDCSGEPTDSLVYLRGGVPMDSEYTIDKRGKDIDHFACCLKMENAKVNATYTLGQGSEKSENTLNIKDTHKVILTEGGRVPNGVRVADWRINGRDICSQNVHLKASPLK